MPISHRRSSDAVHNHADAVENCVVCSNSLRVFPTRKLLEDSFDEREEKSYT